MAEGQSLNSVARPRHACDVTHRAMTEVTGARNYILERHSPSGPFDRADRVRRAGGKLEARGRTRATRRNTVSI
jgi:hypothetical protein